MTTEILIVVCSMLIAACIAFFVSVLVIGRATVLNRHKASFRDFSNSPVHIYEHRMVGLSDAFQIMEKKM